MRRYLAYFGVPQYPAAPTALANASAAAASAVGAMSYHVNTSIAAYYVAGLYRVAASSNAPAVQATPSPTASASPSAAGHRHRRAVLGWSIDDNDGQGGSGDGGGGGGGVAGRSVLQAATSPPPPPSPSPSPPPPAPSPPPPVCTPCTASLSSSLASALCAPLLPQSQNCSAVVQVSCAPLDGTAPAVTFPALPPVLYSTARSCDALLVANFLLPPEISPTTFLLAMQNSQVSGHAVPCRAAHC